MNTYINTLSSYCQPNKYFSLYVKICERAFLRQSPWNIGLIKTINNGDIMKKVKQDQIDNFLKEGWVLGLL